MDAILNTLVTVSGQPAALYLYRRILRDQIAAMGVDATIVANVANDFGLWGTSTSEEGAALEQIVMDQVAAANLTLTADQLTTFVQALGAEIAVDYPMPTTA